MLKRLTVYEIRREVKTNLKAMCSDSLGSIQAAIKKLLAAQLITYSEHTEKGVNKKRYSITAKGRRALADWLEIPADMANSKNMDLGKLLFMGLVPGDKRLPLINEMIINLETELNGLKTLRDSIQDHKHEIRKQAINYWKNDSEYLNNILKMTHKQHISESTDEISSFEMLTLQYGIDLLQFNTDWFKKMKKHIERSNILTHKTKEKNSHEQQSHRYRQRNRRA